MFIFILKISQHIVRMSLTVNGKFDWGSFGYLMCSTVIGAQSENGPDLGKVSCVTERRFNEVVLCCGEMFFSKCKKN